MNNQLKPLSIDPIVIHQAPEGCYCLNDLYKAASEEKSYQPAFFIHGSLTTDFRTVNPMLAHETP